MKKHKLKIMQENYDAFLKIWNNIITVLAAISLVSSVVLIIYHNIKVGSLKEYKKKYDYLRDYDAKIIFYSIFALALALTLYVNTIYTSTVRISIIWFFVRLFVSVSIGTLVVYLTFLLLKYAYPTNLSKKLKKWRYMPRVNPSTGNTMKLLSEEEEDVHLDEGMQAEEDVFSVDYDVWVDPETNEVHIEKYSGHLEAEQCNSCGFMTMKQVKEEIISAPTEDIEGETLKQYQCSYCKAKRSKSKKIARLEPGGSYQLPDSLLFKEDESVQGVSIEIYIGNGKSRIYEFSTTDQAGDFLKEFKIEDTP